MTLVASRYVTPAMAPTHIPPVALPDETCMCCWYVLHADKPYPEDWSSTLCVGHDAWYKTQRLARLARRANRQEFKVVTAS